MKDLKCTHCEALNFILSDEEFECGTCGELNNLENENE